MEATSSNVFIDFTLHFDVILDLLKSHMNDSKHTCIPPQTPNVNVLNHLLCHCLGLHVLYVFFCAT